MEAVRGESSRGKADTSLDVENHVFVNFYALCCFGKHFRLVAVKESCFVSVDVRRRECALAKFV